MAHVKMNLIICLTRGKIEAFAAPNYFKTLTIIRRMGIKYYTNEQKWNKSDEFHFVVIADNENLSKRIQSQPTICRHISRKIVEIFLLSNLKMDLFMSNMSEESLLVHWKLWSSVSWSVLSQWTLMWCRSFFSSFQKKYKWNETGE